MNILKILGIVVTIHVIAFFLMFVSPGCSATARRPAPVASDTMGPAAPVTPSTESQLNPVGTPAAAPMPVSDTSSSEVRYSPTRPGTPAAEALESPPAPKVTPAKTYTVVAGDSLWKIARKHGTTVTELVQANNLANGAHLSVGQKLIIPAKAPAMAGPTEKESTPEATYVVKPGDTLSGIARRIGSTTAAIKQANNLTSDYLQVGQKLRLPTEAAAPSKGAAPAHAAVRAPAGSVVHVVRPGETLGGIAREYHVKVSTLAIANNIADPKLIRAGQKLVIPGGKSPAEAKPAKASAPAKMVPVPASPAATPAATMTPASSTEPPPAAATPPSRDLDSGLKESNSAIPVIKIEGETDTSTSQ